MRYALVFISLIVLCGCSGTSDPKTVSKSPQETERESKTSTASEESDEKPLGPVNWPTTVEATVTDIIADLSEKDKQTLRNTKRDDLIMFHHGWGTGIRNHYGLWRGNHKLIESACGKPCHPDDASMVIIEKVWETLQN
jgi:hypothetical protein